MNVHECKDLARRLKAGTINEDQFIEQLRLLPFQDMGDVKIDTHRSVRKGFAEVIYCPGKSMEQIRSIAESIMDSTEPILFSRATSETAEAVKEILERSVYYPRGRTIASLPMTPPVIPGVTVVTAGTSDIPVGEEAAIMAEYMGCIVDRIYDVGVAGIHRLLSHTELLQASKAIVAVAGMEGALPTIVGGLVSCPVIAVPTSVGYGASLKGFAPLLTMLNSCALGVSVVNIDNGLGAGFCAGQIARQSHHPDENVSPNMKKRGPS